MSQTLSTKSHHLSTEQQRMIHCIRLLGDLLKERPRRSVYRRFAMEQSWPSPESIIRQFGSWAEALAIAGYEWHGEATVDLPDKMPKYTREDIIETLALYSRDMGSIITLKKYQEWRKLHPKAPSHYHIVKTFGSWHDACAEAGLEASVTYSKSELSTALREAIHEMGFSLHSKRIANGQNGTTNHLRKRFFIATVRGRLRFTRSSQKFSIRNYNLSFIRRTPGIRCPPLLR
ncbi:homing endonuclease associated repeat-containing protein [Exiguobacterium mexicanum]|uniref:homing endonuclease associated repeat-containing protein n=1 Tax=Exiguobacterium mexicanum TaxID=340146 RepID=UPI0037BEEBF4